MAPSVNGKLLWIISAVLLITTGLLGCEGDPPPEPDPPTAHDATTALGESVEVSIAGTVIKSPELVDIDGQSALVSVGNDRVFAIQITLKNTGEKPVRYNPIHNAPTGQPDTTPLLFKMPEGDEKLTPIPNVRVGENIYTLEQLQVETQIPPGKSITDEYIFKLPAQGDELLLTIPATLVGGDAGNLARFAIPNEPKVIPSSKPGSLEKPVTKGNIKVAITGVADSYIEAEKLGQDADKELKYPYAYTVEPVLRVDYQVTNSSNQTVIYSPNHKGADSVGVEMIVPGSKDISLPRFKLADADAAPKGQKQGCPCKLEPGQSLKDFMLFQRPTTASKTELDLRISGHLFGSRGLFEFKLPYEMSEPPPPDLEPYKKEQPEEEKEE